MPEGAKEHEEHADQSADSDGQQEGPVNDPLTQTDAGAPKVSWQTSPSEGDDA